MDELGDLANKAYASLVAVADKLSTQSEVIKYLQSRPVPYRLVTAIEVCPFTYTTSAGSTVADGYLGFCLGKWGVVPMIGARSLEIESELKNPRDLIIQLKAHVFCKPEQASELKEFLQTISDQQSVEYVAKKYLQ